jgi:hypothetical protein
VTIRNGSIPCAQPSEAQRIVEHDVEARRECPFHALDCNSAGFLPLPKGNAFAPSKPALLVDVVQADVLRADKPRNSLGECRLAAEREPAHPEESRHAVS